MKRILFIPLFCWTLLSFGQTVKSELAAINRAYEAMQSFSAAVHYDWYANYSATQTTEKVLGEVRREGQQLYQKFPDNEVLITRDFSLMINHEQKLMLLQPAQGEVFSPTLNVNLDSLMQLCDAVDY
ncbi:MAG: hypothetical protein AAF206_25355, partial [Bacteroidota bacterium]